MTDLTMPIPDRLAMLPTITLDGGRHDSFTEGHCAMEVAAWLAGEDHTDHPECVSPVIGAYVRYLNDTWDHDDRQTLVPYLPRTLGTADDGQDEARSYLALDWLIRTYTPTWLDLAGLAGEAQALRDLRRIVDVEATHEAAAALAAALAAARDAAWAAARAATGDAAWVAARDAAWVAAWDAAWAAARAAAGDAAWVAAWAAARAATGDAAWVAAWDAAWAAARDVLRPTAQTLQVSALDLLDAMIDPSAVA